MRLFKLNRGRQRMALSHIFRWYSLRGGSTIGAKGVPDMEALAVAPAMEDELPVTANDIAALAYQLWEARGCPMGSPDEDWYRAEELIASGSR
jgi:hypothetical protein